jgi:hypothetical protein
VVMLVGLFVLGLGVRVLPACGDGSQLLVWVKGSRKRLAAFSSWGVELAVRAQLLQHSVVCGVVVQPPCFEALSSNFA